MADIHERGYWKQYMEAYEACLTANQHPSRALVRRTADDKENARLIVSQIVLDTLSELKMHIPRPPRNAGRN